MTQIVECLAKGADKFKEALLGLHNLYARFVNSLALLLELTFQVRRYLIPLSVFSKLVTFVLESSQFWNGIFVENDILGSLFQQDVLKVEQAFTLSQHITLEALHEIYIFLALQEQAKIAISF